MIRKISIVMASLFILTNCGGMKFHGLSIARPMSMKMTMSEDEGPEIFRQGYADGCQSGYSGYANNFNKMFYTWKQDPILAQDPVYYQIWKDAYAYCANYGMMVEAHELGNWR